jgi:hypothetical protein
MSLKLKEEFLKLLEEDKDFRLTVAGIIGYRDILERFEEYDKKFNEVINELREHRKILNEHTKRFEEHDKKFNEIIIELKEHRKILEEHTRILEEHTKTLGEHTRILGEHTKILGEHTRVLRNHTKRLEEHDKKFNEIINEMRDLKKDVELLSDKVEVTIGSMGKKWGIGLERTVLKIFKETLETKGIEPGKVEKFKFKDENGSITGIKGKIIDVDVLIKDEKLYVIEVKSTAEIDHIEHLIEKTNAIKKILKRLVDKIFLIAINVDKEAYDRAKEANIEVIYSNILEQNI